MRMTSSPAAGNPGVSASLPPGFRARRGLNWATVGLMYTSYYLCRYNFSYANSAIRNEFGFSYEDMSRIIFWNLFAYACGQLVNGFITDHIGGKRAMLVGAAGTVIANILFGAASFWGLFWLFALLWGINGYVQSFGSPGFIKINSSWFSEKGRGTFAGIFGFMINLGRFVANKLLPSLLAGFTFLGMWQIPPQHWRWLFWIPAGVATVVAIVLFFVVKDTPEECGFKDLFKGEADHADTGVRATYAMLFKQVFLNHVVWVMALAYSCTGAVRQAIDQWFPVYFQDVHHLNMKESAYFQWVGFLIPFVASSGSLISGWVSDRFFAARRAPVAAAIYILEMLVIIAAATTAHSVGAAVGFFVAIAFTVNSTHSLLGPAAAMDIGGRKMAAFASGCIDSFQYFGAAVAMWGLGWVLDHKGWSWYFPYLIPFGFIGGIAMFSIAHRKSLKKDPQPAQH